MAPSCPAPPGPVLTVTPGQRAAETISPSQLPASISSYLVAHQARDLDTAIGYYTEDAIAVDEGRTYRGPRQIRDWLATAASETRNATSLATSARSPGRAGGGWR